MRLLDRERDVSRSMVALVASVGALAVLGLVTSVPKWLVGGNGFESVTPGLLTVAPSARGVATLGGGVTVSLYSDGLRIRRGDDLLLQSVAGGSILSAVEGQVTRSGDDTHEQVTRSLDNVRVDELVFLPGRATYFGAVYDGHRSMPMTLRIELAGPVLKLGVNLNGADAVVWHLDHRPLTTGILPALPAVNLRGSARWLAADSPDTVAAMTSSLGTDVGVGPHRVARGVDVRHEGRTDVHVWSDAAFLTVSSQARPRATE